MVEEVNLVLIHNKQYRTKVALLTTLFEVDIPGKLV